MPTVVFRLSMLKLVNKHRSGGSGGGGGGGGGSDSGVVVALLAVIKTTSLSCCKVSVNVVVKCSLPRRITVLSSTMLTTVVTTKSLIIVARFDNSHPLQTVAHARTHFTLDDLR